MKFLGLKCLIITLLGIKCCECSSFEHIWVECPNYKKSKGKAMNATASDETNTNDSDESLSENGNYMAFATPV
jgi:hypothetical protein